MQRSDITERYLVFGVVRIRLGRQMPKEPPALPVLDAVAWSVLVLYFVWMLSRCLLVLVLLVSGCASTTPSPQGLRTPTSGAREPAGRAIARTDAEGDVATTSRGAEAPDRQTTAGQTEGDVDLQGGDEGDEEIIDDGFDDDFHADHPNAQKLPPHPLEELDTSALRAMYLKDPSSVGSISLGEIRGGALVNGVRMPEGEAWIVRQPQAAWGTAETVDAITHCIDKVHREFQETPKLYIGHLSRKNGGRFPPHVSHQNGRDVDLGYYYTVDETWYTRAHIKNLDRERTWALVRAFVTDTDVELILIDRSIQRLLRDHAESIGEDPHWLDQLFGAKTATMRPLIRHARGHATHIHVRFFSPVARETGRRMFPILLKLKHINPPTAYVNHRVRQGQTLIALAKRYRTTTSAIRRANRMRGNMLRTGKIYKIPRAGGVSIINDGAPIVVPPRRLPPPKTIPIVTGAR